MKPLVYISGPLTAGDVIGNVRRAIEVGDVLLNNGFAVLVPHLDILWSFLKPNSYSAWIEQDLVLLAHCDVVYRLNGFSYGSDIETMEANRLNIPVFMECLIPPDKMSPELLHGDWFE